MTNDPSSVAVLRRVDEACQPRIPVLRSFSEGEFGRSGFGMNSSFVIRHLFQLRLGKEAESAMLLPVCAPVAQMDRARVS